MKNKKTVGAYVRVSTTMQEERDSLKTQMHKIRSYCELHDYDLYKIYEDVGSGGDDERVGFQELQKDLDKNKFEILLVYESSRISRKSSTLINFISKLIESKIDFISISQPDLNTTTSTGRLFFTINAGLAQYEREKISERVRSSAFENAKRGKWMAGQLPMGYYWDDMKNILVNSEEADLVRNYFDIFLECQSLKRTAALFNRHIESMRWILTNPFYIGKYRYGVKRNNLYNKKSTIMKDYLMVEGNHIPIISKEIFDQVQLQIRSKTDSNNRSDYLFAGLIKCFCGKKMYGNSTTYKKTGKVYRGYQCDGCKKKIKADVIEEAIFEKLKQMDQLQEINDVNLDNENINKSLEIFERRLKNIIKESEKLLNFFLKDLINESEFTKKREEKNEEKIVVEKEVSILNKILEEKKYDSENNYELLEEVVSNYKNYNCYDLKDLLKMIIKEIPFSKIENKDNFDFDIILNYN